MIEDRLGLATTLALFLGVLGIGVALGASFGLLELQQSCVAAGALPSPGVTVLPGQLEDNACLDGARRMQTLANGAGILGGGLLLGGGVLDRYGEEIRSRRSA